MQSKYQKVLPRWHWRGSSLSSICFLIAYDFCLRWSHSIFPMFVLMMCPRYQVDPAVTKNKPPVLVLPEWDHEDDVAVVRARYKVNNKCVP